MKTLMTTMLILLVCSMMFAETRFFEIGTSYSLLSDNDDWSMEVSRLDYEINTHLDFMLTPDFFVFGKAIIVTDLWGKNRPSYMYMDGDKWPDSWKGSEDLGFSYLQIGAMGYLNDNLRFGGSLYKDAYPLRSRSTILLPSTNWSYGYPLGYFEHSLYIFDLSSSYLLNMGDNSLLLKAGNRKGYSRSATYPNAVTANTDAIYKQSANAFEVGLKYRFGDRDQNVRLLQHRIDSSDRSIPENSVFLEIGTEIKTIMNETKYRDTYTYEQTYTYTSTVVDIDAKLDIMINPDWFFVVNTSLYRNQVWTEKYSINTGDFAYGYKNSDTDGKALPYYSVGVVYYPNDILKLQGLFGREATGWYTYEDWNGWIYRYSYTNRLNLGAELLYFPSVHGLSFSLDYQRYRYSSHYHTNYFGISFKSRFGYRHRNVRNAQHR